MLTPLLTALAKFVAAIGTAVMAFWNLQSEQKKYDDAKALKEQQANQEQK